MADSIAEFARKVQEALGLGKKETLPKREPRKAEVIEPNTARALEVTLTRPEYGHMYDATGKDMGVSRELDGHRTAPYKAGDTMSGDRTQHNPTAVRQKASGEYFRAEKPEDIDARTQEHLRKAGMQGTRNQAMPQEWDAEGKPMHPAEAPVWYKDPKGRMQYEMEKHPPQRVLSKEHRMAAEEALGSARSYANKKATPVLDSEVYGAEEALNAARQLTIPKSQSGTWTGAGHGITDPAINTVNLGVDAAGAVSRALSGAKEEGGRSPTMVREFSNEEDKKRYLEEKSKAVR